MNWLLEIWSSEGLFAVHAIYTQLTGTGHVESELFRVPDYDDRATIKSNWLALPFKNLSQISLGHPRLANSCWRCCCVFVLLSPSVNRFDLAWCLAFHVEKATRLAKCLPLGPLSSVFNSSREDSKWHINVVEAGRTNVSIITCRWKVSLMASSLQLQLLKIRCWVPLLCHTLIWNKQNFHKRQETRRAVYFLLCESWNLENNFWLKIKFVIVVIYTQNRQCKISFC